jgi:hypothetical protein
MPLSLARTLLLLCAGGGASVAQAQAEGDFRVSFGSCSVERRPQPFWSVATERKPQAWVWLGDNIYGDIKASWAELAAQLPRLPERFQPAPPDLLARKYAMQAENEDYQRFLQALNAQEPRSVVSTRGDGLATLQLPPEEQATFLSGDGAVAMNRSFFGSGVGGLQAVAAGTRVFATWDDHDFGLNNGGRTYQWRSASRQLFLDWLGEPLNSPRRTQPGGVHESHQWSIAARGDEQQRAEVRLVLLDNRFARLDENEVAQQLAVVEKEGRKPTSADDNMLSEPQWQWLEAQLEVGSAEATADVVLIGAGLQMLQTDKKAAEGWWRSPGSRERFLRLLARSPIPTVFLLSGDVHFAEIAQARCLWAPGDDSPAFERRIAEVTSSGMTHSWAWGYSPIGTMLYFYYQMFFPAAFRESRWGHQYGFWNIGEVDFDVADRTATFRVLGVDGSTKIQRRFPILLRRDVAAAATAAAGERGEFWRPLASSPKSQAQLGDERDAGAVCRPLNGEVTPLQSTVYALSIAFFALFVVVLPLCAVLWFAVMSVVYVLWRFELRRRERLSRAAKKRS